MCPSHALSTAVTPLVGRDSGHRDNIAYISQMRPWHRSAFLPLLRCVVVLCCHYFFIIIIYL
jgi:hypothetical protein